MRKDLSVTTDAWGNIIVAGPVAVGSSTTFVAKLDKEGTLLWHETLSHGDLFSASASSVPPPAPDRDSFDAIVTDRDSVEPQLLDAEIEAYQHKLGRQGRVARWIAATLAFAGLFAFGIAGGAFAQQATNAGDVTLAHVGVDAAASMRAHHAVETFAAMDTSPMSASAVGAAWPEADVVAPSPERIGITVEPMSAVEDTPEPAVSLEPAVKLDQALVDGYQENVIELQSAVLAHLNTGQFKEAVPLAQRFVKADPTNAFAYLCLGAALQDSGHAVAAVEAYSACARHAERGDVSECIALGGRK